MRNKFMFVIALIITFTFTVSHSFAGDDFEKAMLKAKKNLKSAMDNNDEAKLIKTRGQFERILQLKKQLWLVNYYIALSDYGLAMEGMSKENTDKIKKYTQSGIGVINKSIDENPEFADSYVLLEALNFNRWQYEQDKMQDIISATQSADADAKRLEPENPRYILVTGISQYYTPEAFGGGIKIAMPTLQKSVDLFKTRKEKSNLYPDWGNDMAIGYLALCHIKRDDDGDMTKASELIAEAAKLNPESKFISGYVTGEYKKASSK